MMKRASVLILSVIIVLLLCSCTYSERHEEGGLTILSGTYPFSASGNPDGLAVSVFTWDGNNSNMDIVIPDKYDSKPIKKLGGYYGRGFPTPFFIDDTSWMDLHSDAEFTEDNGCFILLYDDFKENLDEYSEIIYHDFNLHIGKYINEIYSRTDVTVYGKNDAKTAYCPRVTVDCDENNKTFYSKNGKLYFRKNDKLVDKFLYAE